MRKRILIVFGVGAVLGLAVGSIVWFAPQSTVGKAIMSAVMTVAEPKKEKAEDVKGIVVNAPALAKEYGADEKASDAKYLNKAIQVTGVISEIDNNNDGGVMLVLGTDDPTMGVQCAMREKNVSGTKGQNVTLIGFCSGNGITGVSLTDCIIVK
jgi:hypothetical protein